MQQVKYDLSPFFVFAPSKVELDRSFQRNLLLHILPVIYSLKQWLRLSLYFVQRHEYYPFTTSQTECFDIIGLTRNTLHHGVGNLPTP